MSYVLIRSSIHKFPYLLEHLFVFDRHHDATEYFVWMSLGSNDMSVVCLCGALFLIGCVCQSEKNRNFA